MPYSSKDSGSCLQHSFNSQASSNNVVGDSDTISSLFILTHPLEEIQVRIFFPPLFIIHLFLLSSNTLF